jgi:hypothetical protein
MPNVFVESLAPNVTPQFSISFPAVTIKVQNNSNCWLYYNGNLMAQPWQQKIDDFPSGDTAPNLLLSSTAPNGQQSQPNPQGNCQITLYDIWLPPNPGVIGAQVSTTSNQILLADYTVPANFGSFMPPITIPPFIQSLLITTNHFPVTVQLTGVESGIVLTTSIGNAALTNNDLAVLSLSSIEDTAMTVFITNNNSVKTHVTITGLPAFGSVAIGDQPINVTVTSASAGPGVSLVVNATATHLAVPWQNTGVQSITVFNSGTGSCNIQVTGVTSGFNYFGASTPLSSQASLSTKVYPQFDGGGFNLTISNVVGTVNIDVTGNLYPLTEPKAYGLAISGQSVLASDRPLDSWVANDVPGTGVALTVSRAAPGAGLQHVITGWSLQLLAFGGAVAAGNVGLSLQGTQKLINPGIAQNADVYYSETNLRLLCAVNTAATMSMGAQANLYSVGYLTGFTISSPNS